MASLGIENEYGEIEMLRLRLLTALFAVPILIIFVRVASVEAMAAVLLFSVVVSSFELQRLYFLALRQLCNYDYERFQKFDRLMIPTLSGALFCALSGLFLEWVSVSTFLTISILLGLSACLLPFVPVSASPIGILFRLSGFAFVTSYTVLPWVALLKLFNQGAFGSYFLLVFLIAMMGDTGAYAVGNLMGRRKLAPVLSPNKTIEGVAGGLVFSILGVLVYYSFNMTGEEPLSILLLCAVLGGAAGVCGDLAESTIKRAAKVKDSGVFFPGHGGFLDRLDSVLWIGPVVLVTLSVFHGFSR